MLNKSAPASWELGGTKCHRHISWPVAYSDVASVPFHGVKYTRINSTNSPASGAGNVSKPRLMPQARTVREFVCAQISVFLQSERWRRQYWSAYVAADIT